jgi:hypothetical protein
MIKIKVAILFCLIIGSNSYCQNDRAVYIGMNVLQLPASTINANISMECKPYLTPIIDIGYTLNYSKAVSTDWIGGWLTPHSKMYDGFGFVKQSGEYIKLGTFLNLRQDYTKTNYFHIGLFLTNSLVYEKIPTMTTATTEDHTIYLPGFNLSFGYEMKLTKRIKADLDYQLSFPGKNYNELYSFRSFVPGMGYKDTYRKWYPMMILFNIKYRL